MAPPSTTISVPETMAESSEARYKTAFATSSASLNLLRGMVWLTRCSNSLSASSVGVIRDQIGVRVAPGVTWFTRILRGANSEAKASESRYPEHGLHRTIQDDRRAIIQMRRRGLNGEENARQVGANDFFELGD